MKPCIVMQSDFGNEGSLVAQMHGVCKKVDPALDIQDITHIIDAFDIRRASKLLASTLTCWPVGTVFVSVVDPGVGSSRKACVARTGNGYYIVTPDNGTLTLVDSLYGIEAVREIDEKINRYKDSELVNVFHGRDLFSYTAARLASGIIDFNQVGPSYEVSGIVRYERLPYSIAEGQAEGFAHGDPAKNFGILDTNIPNKEFPKTGIKVFDKVKLVLALDQRIVFERTIQFCNTFADVKKGEVLLYNEVDLNLGIASNMANFAEQYAIEGGKEYKLSLIKEP